MTHTGTVSLRVNGVLADRGLIRCAAPGRADLMALWAARGPFGNVRRVFTLLAELARRTPFPRRLLWVAAVMAATQNDYNASAEVTGEAPRIGRASG